MRMRTTCLGEVRTPTIESFGSLKRMQWLIIIVWVGLLVSPGWNEKLEERAIFNRQIIGNVINNKSAEAVRKLGEWSSRGTKKLGQISAAIVNPASSKVGNGLEKLRDKASTVVENIGNESSNVVNHSIGTVKHVLDKIVNLTLTDEEIEGLQAFMAKRMGIRNYKEVDIPRFRSLFGELFDSSTNILRSDKTYCGICKLLVRKIQFFGLSIVKLGEIICDIYILLSTLTFSDFCNDMVTLNLPVLQYILDNSQILDPELACTILLQTKDCYYPKSALSWTTAVPITPPIYPDIHLNSANETTKPLKILHLTDTHITIDYEKGAVANCGYPTCCKSGLGNTIRGQKAGAWGDYNCDVPPWLFGSTLLHINQTHEDIDFVYFTGDIIDHTSWNTSIQANTELIYYTYKAMQQSFPNIPILPVIGNHESTPLNVFPPHNQDIHAKGLSNNWLYELMAKLWSPWLPGKAIETVKRQGYYAYSFNKKLKIIGLNNNICYIFNWWLLFSTEFLNEQLQFLVKELEESEKNGQFVHILGHVSMGNQECIEPWEVSYNAIVRRYAHIIKGQFVGHTHSDELKIFYDGNNKPINMAYNGASLTPYLENNPNYKILEVDPNTMEVTNIHTYIFNLTEANLHEDRSPVWYKLYSMKEAYGLPDLSPQSFDVLADKMFKNSSLSYLYWRFYVRDGDAALKRGCGADCRTDLLCKFVTTHSLHPAKSQCDGL